MQIKAPGSSSSSWMDRPNKFLRIIPSRHNHLNMSGLCLRKVSKSHQHLMKTRSFLWLIQISRNCWQINVFTNHWPDMSLPAHLEQKWQVGLCENFPPFQIGQLAIFARWCFKFVWISQNLACIRNGNAFQLNFSNGPRSGGVVTYGHIHDGWGGWVGGGGGLWLGEGRGGCWEGSVGAMPDLSLFRRAVSLPLYSCQVATRVCTAVHPRSWYTNSVDYEVRTCKNLKSRDLSWSNITHKKQQNWHYKLKLRNLWLCNAVEVASSIPYLCDLSSETTAEREAALDHKLSTNNVSLFVIVLFNSSIE